MRIDAPPWTGSITIDDEQSQFRPERYRWDFDQAGDGWDTGGAQSDISGGIYTSIGPWSDDNNHDPPGLANHSFVRLQSANEEVVNGVITNPMMFPNAQMGLRFRGVGWSAGGCAVRPWVQSRFPGGIDKYTNYFLSSVDLAPLVADGDWHDLVLQLTADPAAWTYAPYVNPDPNGRYGLLDFATAQRHVHNFFPLMFTRAVGAPAASGSIQLDYIDLWYLRRIQAAVVPPPSGGWTIILNPSLNTASSGNSGLVFRGIGSASPVGGTKARLTVRGHPSQPTSVSKVSFERRAGSSGFAFAHQPQEVKFNSGQSGYNNLAAGAPLLSDELTLDVPWQAGDVPIVHFEASSDAQSRTAASFAGGCYYGGFPGTWNIQAPGGSWSQTGLYFGAMVEIK